MKTSAPLVAIECLAYNHGPYIRQCLDGFVMQKTDFPFIAIVHDDASTDDTAKIIREYAQNYPDIIKPILETENQYSKKDGSLGRIIKKAIPEDVKYIALCEGDDYWTDPYKLQKQVDYMEEDHACGLVYTSVRYYSQKEQKFTIYFGERRCSIQDFAKKGNAIPTLSVLYRREIARLYYKDIQPDKHDWAMGDLPMWLYFAYKSKLGFIPDCTGVYRVLEDSASHFTSQRDLFKFQLNSFEIISYFVQKFNLSCPEAEINLMWNKFYYYAKIDDLEALNKVVSCVEAYSHRRCSIKLFLLRLLKDRPQFILSIVDFSRRIRGLPL